MAATIGETEAVVTCPTCSGPTATDITGKPWCALCGRGPALDGILKQREKTYEELGNIVDIAKKWMKEGAWVSVKYHYREARNLDGIHDEFGRRILHPAGAKVEDVLTGVTIGIKWDTE